MILAYLLLQHPACNKRLLNTNLIINCKKPNKDKREHLTKSVGKPNAPRFPWLIESMVY